jgi:putative transcriptional regulator
MGHDGPRREPQFGSHSEDCRRSILVALNVTALPMKNRLKVLRAERNWTQADLAGALDVSRQTINAIETGKFDPSLPLAFRAARLFGLRIEEIFEDDDRRSLATRIE